MNYLQVLLHLNIKKIIKIKINMIFILIHENIIYNCVYYKLNLIIFLLF